MMNPNRFLEERAGYLIRSVRQALGDSASSGDVLAVVEDRDRLAEFAEGREGVRDYLLRGRLAEIQRAVAVALLRDRIAAENAPGFWEEKANSLISAVVKAFPDRAPLDVLEDPAASSLLRARVPTHYDGGPDDEIIRFAALRMLREHEARLRWWRDLGEDGANDGPAERP